MLFFRKRKIEIINIMNKKNFHVFVKFMLCFYLLFFFRRKEILPHESGNVTIKVSKNTKCSKANAWSVEQCIVYFHNQLLMECFLLYKLSDQFSSSFLCFHFFFRECCQEEQKILMQQDSVPFKLTSV